MLGALRNQAGKFDLFLTIAILKPVPQLLVCKADTSVPTQLLEVL